MKRDMDLIRQILLKIETATEEVSFEKPDEAYNAALLRDAGLLEANLTSGGPGRIMRTSVQRLTWAGHDFLDSTRDETIWNKAKARVLKPGVSWTFAMLGEFLKAEAQRQLSTALGVPPAP